MKYKIYVIDNPDNSLFDFNLADFAEANGYIFCRETEQYQIEQNSLVVRYAAHKLSISRFESNETPITVDFLHGKFAHRRMFGGGKNQSIAKAVGLHKGAKPTVLDATAGFGSDGFLLGCLGCQVTLIERHPIIAALLKDGLYRASLNTDLSAVMNRINMITGDAVEFIDSMVKLRKQMDVVYLDPMFPRRSKSAQVKKQMRLLQDLLEEHGNSDKLFNQAMKLAKHRVVVKRSRHAVELGSEKPSFRIEGKSCRYDVYAIKSFS